VTVDPKLYHYRARVVMVIDGATLALELDLGFGVQVSRRVGLVGLTAPPIDTPEGEAAKRRVQDWIRLISGLAEWPFIASTYRVTGRPEMMAALTRGGRSLSAELMIAGHTGGI
jgi:endonuclease YncB( thermonuclease family)